MAGWLEEQNTVKYLFGLKEDIFLSDTMIQWHLYTQEWHNKTDSVTIQLQDTRATILTVFIDNNISNTIMLPITTVTEAKEDSCIFIPGLSVTVHWLLLLKCSHPNCQQQATSDSKLISDLASHHWCRQSSSLCHEFVDSVENWLTLCIRSYVARSLRDVMMLRQSVFLACRDHV